mmetsp:Transcript_1657/g.5775  ORF Transcript_1657/g.5775 Transcript_1657/m.5775 type:complete len:202 (+) Transcript_1657:2393-2998(+)
MIIDSVPPLVIPPQVFSSPFIMEHVILITSASNFLMLGKVSGCNGFVSENKEYASFNNFSCAASFEYTCPLTYFLFKISVSCAFMRFMRERICWVGVPSSGSSLSTLSPFTPGNPLAASSIFSSIAFSNCVFNPGVEFKMSNKVCSLRDFRREDRRRVEDEVRRMSCHGERFEREVLRDVRREKRDDEEEGFVVVVLLVVN